MKRYLIPILILALILLPVTPAMAATTADVTVTAQLSFIGYTDNVSSYDYGLVATSSTTNSSTSWVGITNTSSIQTDITIAVTTENWSGGIEWVHSNTATPGANTAGLNSNRGGTWGVGDVVVESSVTGSPNYIYEDCTALTDFEYGISFKAPTSGDGVQHSITLRIEGVAG